MSPGSTKSWSALLHSMQAVLTTKWPHSIIVSITSVKHMPSHSLAISSVRLVKPFEKLVWGVTIPQWASLVAQHFVYQHIKIGFASKLDTPEHSLHCMTENTFQKRMHWISWHATKDATGITSKANITIKCVAEYMNWEIMEFGQNTFLFCYALASLGGIFASITSAIACCCSFWILLCRR